MIVDSSAIIAILLREPDADRYSRCLAEAAHRMMSAVARVELAFVLEGRYGETGRSSLERSLRESQIEVVAVSSHQAEIAIDAFRRFGRGRHRAALNIGDCFSYALAIATDQPLLFKGNDFVHTDVRAALTSGRL